MNVDRHQSNFRGPSMACWVGRNSEISLQEIIHEMVKAYCAQAKQ